MVLFFMNIVEYKSPVSGFFYLTFRHADAGTLSHKVL